MGAVKISRQVHIAADPAACYAFWSDPQNFERTFDVISKVAPDPSAAERSIWTLQLPSGKEETVTMQRHADPPTSLAWLTVEGPMTFNTGFGFAPHADGGTAMSLETEIGMGGLQGMMLPAMKPVIEQKIDDVLTRFRQAVETG